MLRFGILAILFCRLEAAQQSALPDSRLLDEANTHYRGNRPEAAARLYREYLQSDPNRADVRVFLGAALLSLNQLDAALAEARRAIESDPKSSKAYLLAGRVHAGQRQWHIAQEFFAKAIRLNESDRDAWYFSGRAFYQAGRLREAISALLRAGSHSRVYEHLGLAYDADGQYVEAEAAFKHAVETANGAYRPYFAYGAFLFRQNRVGESIAMLQAAARLQPESVETVFELARALYQSGRLTEALAILPATVSAENCRVYNLRGRIYLHLDQAEQAKQALAAFRTCADHSAGSQP